MATGIESVLNPEVAGGGAESRILYLENTATEADVQDGLNSADYDIVLLQGGVWASAFSSDLTVPEGKLLIGAAWGGDLDDNANPPHITFDSDAQLLVSGQIENLSLIFDAANTTDLIVGTMGIGHRIYVYTSDGAWHGQYALTGTWRSFTSFGITGLNGLNPARLTDVTEGWAIFQKGYINPGDTVNARGINLAPVGALEAYMDFRDIELASDQAGAVITADYASCRIREGEGL